MHPRVMAARDQMARERVMRAAGALAERCGAGDQLAALRSLRVPGNDQRVRAVVEREALAALLESIAEAATTPRTRKADQHAATPA